MLIEIDSRCNLNCKTCPRKDRPNQQGSMTMETFKECIDKLVESNLSKEIYIAGYGESMLNPKFFDMIKYAKRFRCYISMPTNATMINEKNIKRLRMVDAIYLSIDSLKNKKLRTQDPNDVLNLLDLMRFYHMQPFFNVTLGSENWDEIDDFITFGVKNQIGINFTAPRPLNPNDKFLMSETQFVGDHAYSLREKIRPYPYVYFDEYCRSFSHCKSRNDDIAIAWNGDIFPCSAAFFQDFKFGNIKDFDTLSDIVCHSKVCDAWEGLHPVCDYCKEYDKTYKSGKSQSIIELEKLRNLYDGKRCFILGTGKSLTRSTIELLRNEITIGVNGIAFAKNMWDFEADFLCFSDISMFSLRADYEALKSLASSTVIYTDFFDYFALSIDFVKLTSEQIKILENSINVRWKNAGWGVSFHVNSTKDISFDLINEGTAMCGTIIQDLAIPLAAWLGCKEVYLLGCDCTTDGHFYDEDDATNKLNSYGTNQYKYFKDKLNEADIKFFNLSPSSIPHIENRTLDQILNQ